MGRDADGAPGQQGVGNCRGEGNPLCASAVRHGPTAYSCKQLEPVHIGTYLSDAAVDPHANLLEAKVMQMVFACSDNGEGLEVKTSPAGNARGKAGACGEVPHLVPPPAQHLALLVFVPAGLHEGRVHPELLDGAHARTVVAGVIGVAPVEHGGKSEPFGSTHELAKPAELAVVATIGGIGRHKGVGKRVGLDNGNAKPRPFKAIALALKRSALGGPNEWGV